MLNLFSATIISGFTPLVSCFLALFSFRHLSASSSSRLTSLLLGLSTGLMFAIATLELLPEAVALSQPGQPEGVCFPHHSSSLESDSSDVGRSIHNEHGHHGEESHLAVQKNLMGCGVGFLFLLGIQQALSSFGGHGHSHHMKKEPLDMPIIPEKGGFRLVTFIALGVHCLIDGLIIAGAYNASEGIGASVAIAIILHKIPDGILLVTLLWISKSQNDIDASPANLLSDRTSLAIVATLSFMTPLGAYITSAFVSTTDYNGFILAFGAGTFLFITTMEIIPEMLRDKTHRLISLFTLAAGYGAFFLFEMFAHASQEAIE